MSGYYRNMEVWQRAMDVGEVVFALSWRLPKEETYATGDQMRRAALSIPSNIAEGYGRWTHKEFVRFLNIANGSRMELETQLQMCVRLKYLPAEEVESALKGLEEIGRMIVRLIRSLSK